MDSTTIREYFSIAEYGQDSRQMVNAGWRPVSLSTTLSRNIFWYLTLGMGARDTVYHVLYVQG